MPTSQHAPHRRRALVAATLVAGACAAAAPPDPSPARELAGFELAAGVVVEPSGALYLARPEGGIEAVDPGTGERRWASDAAARPLVALGGRLLAQREAGEGLPLALLDTAGGGPLATIDVPLPAGVSAAVDETVRVSFTVEARPVEGRALLEWVYLERDPMGVSPPGGRPFARRERGAVRVDLASGAAEAVERGAPPAAEESLPAPVARLLTAGELPRPPWRAGDLLAAAERRYAPSERLVLRRWRAATGEALPEVTLSEGRALAALPSADRRHLLVVTLADGPPDAGRFAWAIHSLATGELLRRLPADGSARPFCLVDAGLVVIEPPLGRRVEGGWQELPRRLRLVDPETGEERWWRPVRDPSLRAAPPPGS